MNRETTSVRPRAGNLTPASALAVIPLAVLAAWALLGKPPRHDERGDVIVQHLGVILLAVVALVVLFAAIQLLGVDVIKSIRTQLNL